MVRVLIQRFSDVERMEDEGVGMTTCDTRAVRGLGCEAVGATSG
jgi:hypothetical protein